MAHFCIEPIGHKCSLSSVDLFPPHSKEIETYNCKARAYDHHKIDPGFQIHNSRTGKEISPKVTLIGPKHLWLNVQKWSQKINGKWDAEHLGEKADKESGSEACALPLSG